MSLGICQYKKFRGCAKFRACIKSLTISKSGKIGSSRIFPDFPGSHDMPWDLSWISLDLSRIFDLSIKSPYKVKSGTNRNAFRFVPDFRFKYKFPYKVKSGANRNVPICPGFRFVGDFIPKTEIRDKSRVIQDKSHGIS